ncbi:CEP68 protein, partial [Neodrepanis coruscans]|nr:CEP68 protein [Neodrepanis coruscans]
EQVKASGCWDLTPSSAGENILAGSRQICRRRQSLGARSSLPSTPELLQPQTPPSPGSALRSRSAPSSGERGLSEEPLGSFPSSMDDVPSFPVATRDLCLPAEGRALRAPLLDYRIREVSSYQADYWACAIPDSLPPSPDRRSPHWNPNKEYEDLLDYAYPLKPRYKLGRMPEPFLHDSGIGLDSFSVSPEGTPRSTSVYSRGGQTRGSREGGRWEFVAPAGRFSTPGPGKRGCSGTGSYCETLPIAKASFTRSASSHPSRGFVKDVRMESAGPSSTGCPAVDGRSWRTRGSPFPSLTGQAKSTNRFLPVTGVLPLRKEWEGDEEFLSLPPRLQELGRLAQFLSSLSLRTPGHDLPRHRQPLPSRLTLFGEASGRDERGNIEGYAGRWQRCSSPKPSWENTESCGWIHRDSLRGLHLPAGLRDTLDGMYLNEPRVRGHPKRSQQSESLVQCVQV